MTSTLVHSAKSGKERTFLAAQSFAFYLREIKQNRPPKGFYREIRDFRRHEFDRDTTREKSINSVFYFMKNNSANLTNPKFPAQVKLLVTGCQSEIEAKEAVLADHASKLVSRFSKNARVSERLDHWEPIQIVSGMVAGVISFVTIMSLGDLILKTAQTGFGIFESVWGAVIAGSIAFSFYAHNRMTLLRSYKRAEELSKKPRLLSKEEVRASS